MVSYREVQVGSSLQRINHQQPLSPNEQDAYDVPISLLDDTPNVWQILAVLARWEPFGVGSDDPVHLAMILRKDLRVEGHHHEESQDSRSGL